MRLPRGEFRRSGAEIERQLSAEQFASHLDAGRVIDRVTQEAFVYSAASVKNNKSSLTRATSVAMDDSSQFRSGGITTDEPPIVAVGPHSRRPDITSRARRLRSHPAKRSRLLLSMFGASLDRAGGVWLAISLGSVATWALGSQRKQSQDFSPLWPRPGTARSHSRSANP